MELIARGALTGLVWFQALSTVAGWVTLWGFPQLYAPVLEPTAFAGRTFLGGILLGLVVGGFQWAALWIAWRRPRWFALGHLLAGVVMVGWIFGDCLVLNSFIWAHALWGGIGLAQVALVSVSLGALRPRQTGKPRPR